MRLSRSILFLVAVLTGFTCNFSSGESVQKIKSLEYRREINRKTFIRCLNSPDEEIREQAVLSLGRIQDTATIAWVVNRLSDRNDSVRAKAAFALGEFSVTTPEQPLLDAIKREISIPVLTRMIDALGKVGTEISFPVMNNYLQSDIPDYQVAAATGCGIMAYRGYRPYETMGNISRLLQSGSNPDLRWRCAYALYQTGSPPEFEALLGSLLDPDPLTRFFSLKAQTVILNYVKSSLPRKYQTNTVIREIARIADSPEYQNRLSILMEDSTWYVRLAALQLLEVLKPPSLFRKIQKRLDDENPHIRTAAMQTIGTYKTAAAADQLDKIIRRSSNWREQGFALYQLSRFRPQKALRFVEDNVNNTAWPENYYLLLTLDNIDNFQSTQLLRKMSNTNNKAELSRVLESLVNRAGLSMDLMFDKLQLHDPAVTTIIAGKLAKIKDTVAISPLIDGYHYFQPPQDVEPMLAIIAALDSIGSLESVDFLQEVKNSPFPAVRDAAINALQKLTHQLVSTRDTANYPALKYDFPMVAADSRPLVKFFTTCGDFEMMLFPDKAPVTVANFLDLVRSDFYNNIYFHRVVPGFVIQAGDPRGDGWGGPGYCIPCEYNNIFYDRGVVGMAHAGKDTGGSQFFITQIPQPHLNGRHTAFGKLVSGWDVMDRIEIYDRILHVEIVK